MDIKETIMELLAAGATPEEIYALAQAAQEDTELNKRRSEVLTAIFNYVMYLVPDMEITREDRDNMIDYMKDFESRIKKFITPPAADEEADAEDAIRRFLIKLGC